MNAYFMMAALFAVVAVLQAIDAAMLEIADALVERRGDFLGARLDGVMRCFQARVQRVRGFAAATVDLVGDEIETAHHAVLELLDAAVERRGEPLAHRLVVAVCVPQGAHECIPPLFEGAELLPRPGRRDVHPQIPVEVHLQRHDDTCTSAVGQVSASSMWGARRVEYTPVIGSLV